MGELGPSILPDAITYTAGVCPCRSSKRAVLTLFTLGKQSSQALQLLVGMHRTAWDLACSPMMQRSAHARGRAAGHRLCCDASQRSWGARSEAGLMPVLQPHRALALWVCGYGIERASGGVSRSVWRLILSSLLSMVRELVHTNSSSTPCRLSLRLLALSSGSDHPQLGL